MSSPLHHFDRHEAGIKALRKALEPFLATALKVPDHWRADVPLKQQRGGYDLPTVQEYRDLLAAAQQLLWVQPVPELPAGSCTKLGSTCSEQFCMLKEGHDGDCIPVPF